MSRQAENAVQPFHLSSHTNQNQRSKKKIKLLVSGVCGCCSRETELRLPHQVPLQGDASCRRGQHHLSRRQQSAVTPQHEQTGRIDRQHLRPHSSNTYFFSFDLFVLETRRPRGSSHLPSGAAGGSEQQNRQRAKAAVHQSTGS